MDICRSFAGIVYRATLLRAVRSCVRGKAIFRINSFTEYKRSGLSMARKLNLAATLWNSFNSSPNEKIIFLSDLFWRIVPFCRSAQLTDLTGFGPPTSSVPGVATPLASISPKAFKARKTCCWSGSYSIPNCRTVSVLPKKLAVRDCDDAGPQLQLCSVQMQFAANSAHALAPRVGPL